MSTCRALSRALRLNQPARTRLFHSSAARSAATSTRESPRGPLQDPDAWKLREGSPAKSGARKPVRAKGLFINHPERDQPIIFSKAWLRDACRCPQCVDPHSGQKNFASAQVSLDPEICDAVKTDSGALRITWANDHLSSGEHVSEYPAEVVQRWIEAPYENIPVSWGSQGTPELWDAKLLRSREPFYTYDSFMAGGDEFLTACDTLRLYGLFFLRGVPKSETAVEDIAAKMGIIQETFYGRTWDVRSKPKAENVAYTSSFLGLHQDLLYMRNPPKLQLLHCLENDTEGGEALFSDGGRAAQQLRVTNPLFGDKLSKTHTVFRYDKRGFEYERAHPAITDSPRLISWSPPFQRPEQGFSKTARGAGEHDLWLRATKLLQRLIESPEYVFEYRYKPGDCVIFDNTRLLHGRKQFDAAGGARWLKGTYVDQDSYLNTLYQAAKLRKPEEPKTAPADATKAYALQWQKEHNHEK
ncbi:uncharacterized protein B0I36DRAFT_321658 [Microdochium trichocladiopsis]|uniref:Gamma-butyrobetaine dioxygenase n=1 Tax=Microdochium trichocladiopsis TaxID=1682393 RepID=A0A9P8YA88_9PEZI|nr:uncharacterized protein B0I36DRAFT_321658 [Microdochium trichocladiopsis]KAH7033546.1 hypothetical protein B0I36DRAFT_321658 [Microdochium trichocladiopsis]